jgi:hypothetical protein
VNSFSLEGEGQDEGNLKEFFLMLILLTPTLSATAPALPYYLHPCRHPAGEGVKSLTYIIGYKPLLYSYPQA